MTQPPHARLEADAGQRIMAIETYDWAKIEDTFPYIYAMKPVRRTQFIMPRPFQPTDIIISIDWLCRRNLLAPVVMDARSTQSPGTVENRRPR